MTPVLLALPVLAPLGAAGLLVLWSRNHLGGSPAVPRVVGWGVTATVLAVSVTLLTDTLDGEVQTLQLGGWPPGIAIVLVADVLAALMMTVTALLVLLSLVFAAATGEDDGHMIVLAMVLSTGVYGAVLTGDLFSLFVFVEMMLVPSYVLLIRSGGQRRLAAGQRYVSVNLLASTLFLAGVGLLYGVTGTVSLGELAGAARAPAAAIATAVVLLALGIKSAVVPWHSWLPGSYAVAGPAVVVLFSGLLTKVGVYALFRVYAVVFDGDRRWLWVFLVLAVITMVVGVLAALGERSMRSVLTFHMVSQIGYMLLGLGLFTTAGLSAGVFFLIQYVLVKAALLMCAGAIEVTYGTDELRRLGGLGRTEPALAIAFGVSALALVGVPPLSGFVAKLHLVQAAVSEQHYVAVAAVAVVSLLTLTSMLKLWNAVFTEPEHSAPPDAGRPTASTSVLAPAPAVALFPKAGRIAPRRLLLAPMLLLTGLAVVLGLAAEPLLEVCERAAEGLIDVRAYVEAVSSP
ncbi:monovalent cation/H+ antiporter subunit D family protein [Nocardioides ferulae]|uniref:monovalent cation/H+ antiporter subunit D family protein n=1 Tax=Nocardioides ferulae TaxID=2340821 RepID=UPI000EAEF777|nr:monovalent cation/H+ antiporter subunit D family protein [Nocardioides ferulae]